jgi:hypothetical protein
MSGRHVVERLDEDVRTLSGRHVLEYHRGDKCIDVSRVPDRKNVPGGYNRVYIKCLQSVMELTISDKTLRKILIGVVVAAVILLIVNAYFRRSN